jgi:hypothetical protein
MFFFRKNKLFKNNVTIEPYVIGHAESNEHICKVGKVIFTKSNLNLLSQPLCHKKIEKIKAVRLESGPKKSQGLSLNRSQIYSALRTYNTPTESQVVYK